MKPGRPPGVSVVVVGSVGVGAGGSGVGVGSGVVVVIDLRGLLGIDGAAAGLVLLVSTAVGYLTVLVRRVAFWGVRVGFGGLAVVVGLVVLLS